MATPIDVPHPPQRNRFRWWVPLALLAAVLGGMVLGIVVLIGVVVAGLSGAAGSLATEEEVPTVREHSIVLLHLPRGVREEQYTPPVLFSAEGRPSLLDVISTIRYASQDAKVDGILLRRCAGLSIAQARELRSELLEFKKSGKWIYAFLDGGNEADYYLASVADSIFVAPLAWIEFNGLGGVIPFFKNLSDKLGVSWTVIQREQYKSAGEQFSRTRFSEPARQEVWEILQQRYQRFVNDVAQGRNIEPRHIEELLNQGVYAAEDFVRYGLADVTMTYQQLRDFLSRKVYSDTIKTKKLRFVRPATYARYAREQTSDAVDQSKTIAIIAAVGSIRSGSRSGDAEEIASASLCADIRKAADDTTIKAIILRINSPGGSAQASEEIWHELQRARAKKPVYASMSSVAASGGYYVAAGCDTIIAAPETITGSIGVIAAIPNFSKLMTSVGVTFDTLRTNTNALFLNGVLPMQESERRQLELLIDTIYQRFLERVAFNRHTTVEQIRPLAGGRVWSGEAAYKQKLVDVIGGLSDAIELAKRRIGVSADKRPRIKFYPEREDFATAFMRLVRRISDDSDDEEQAIARALGVSTQTLGIASLLNPARDAELWRILGLLRLARRERALALMPITMPQW